VAVFKGMGIVYFWGDNPLFNSSCEFMQRRVEVDIQFHFSIVVFPLNPLFFLGKEKKTDGNMPLDTTKSSSFFKPTDLAAIYAMWRLGCPVLA
jgi:hypothetical protein